MSAESPDITDPRIARARAMREAGAETAEIARACGVGVSTIYRWAEAYGFRVCDLEAAAWAASGRGDGTDVSPSPEFPDAQSARRDLPPRVALHSDGDPGAGPGIQVEMEEDSDAAEITPAQWAAMARGLKQRALRLTEAGRLRQAEQALRLAERYERMQSGAAPAPAKDDGVDYRALLEAKLTRLHEHYMQKAELKEDEAFSPEQRAALGIPPLPDEGGEAIAPD